MILRKALVVLSVLLLLLPSTSTSSTPLVPKDETCCIATASDDAAVAASITSLAMNDARNVLRQAYNHGITQKEFTDHMDAVMRSEGSDGALSYPTVIMAYDESTKPYGHSNDDETHVISPIAERLAVVRAAARVNGQCVDVTRTFLFETATPEMRDAYKTVLATEEAVIGNISAGVSIAYLDGIVRTYLAGYIADENASASTYWGHGVGEKVIVDPLLHNETDATELLEGQIIAIQIWVYFGTGWYVRVEDTVLVTLTGASVLSSAPKALDDISVFLNSSYVDTDIAVGNYSYGNSVMANCSIRDSANRSLSSVSYFDGISWASMHAGENHSYDLDYNLDHSYASHITGIVRVGIDGVYTYHTILLDASLNSSYDDALVPPISIVFEQVTIDTLLSWSFSRIGADMVRIHFSKVYPPPGDQFLLKDAQGRVVFEYKWNLGASAMSPWVSGNTLTVEVVPTWASIYGGVNHFYFEIDVMSVYDPEATTSTTTTSTFTTTSTSTTTTTTSTTTTGFSAFDPAILATGIGLVCVFALVAVFLRRR